MNIFKNPPRENWRNLCERPQLDLDSLTGTVKNILENVKRSGDRALIDLTLKFDNVSLEQLEVTNDEIQQSEKYLSASLKNSIQLAARNIQKFHAAQKRDVLTIDTMPGVTCWRKATPIEKIGIYIPGGSAPLFSTVLMLGIPATLGGCKEVILCTPPNEKGGVNSAILYAARLVGVTRIFKAGGAQAIAAMAYGTESIPQVYKIFGPGNQFVTKAKQLVSEEGVAIDMPAGPSEVLVIADETADPSFIASDLLSQAEHGPDSQVMLVVNEKVTVDSIIKEIKNQLETLPRKDTAEKALANSRIIIFDEESAGIDFVNEYAPEHLIINTKNSDEVAGKITNAGSVFLGAYTPESAGDYASGTNHTLPTNGYAKAYAGVSLDSFVKYITFQKITQEGIKTLGPIVEEMAEAELLQAHKRAISIRLKQINS
ncbi:MAG TPA: histidinol dehydrogenase [Cyclobacteriaceae bacterium]|nr:histidinol dehydrogenase [Cyclobacteriaceae bacterium]